MNTGNFKYNIFDNNEITGRLRTALIALVLSFYFYSPVVSYAQEEPANEPKPEEFQTVRLPVNLYDSFRFDERNWNSVRTAVYLIGPCFVTMWGIMEWAWFSETKFDYKPSSLFAKKTYSGDEDKFGHLFGTYAIKRFSTFLFGASGSSKLSANIEGAIYAETVQLLLEIGDGISIENGFDPYDVMFNNIGILTGFILDWFPTLDRMIALQWEYVPTRKFVREFQLFSKRMDVFTDYGGQKFLLTTKLGGIPYLSRTPLRYVNIDLGYYARRDKNYSYSADEEVVFKRNLSIGFSVNFSFLAGDILPVGYASSTAQTFFNYYHVPYDIEAWTWHP